MAEANSTLPYQKNEGSWWAPSIKGIIYCAKCKRHVLKYEVAVHLSFQESLCGYWVAFQGVHDLTIAASRCLPQLQPGEKVSQTTDIAAVAPLSILFQGSGKTFSPLPPPSKPGISYTHRFIGLILRGDQAI
jgi:hypothetical protein